VLQSCFITSPVLREPPTVANDYLVSNQNTVYPWDENTLTTTTMKEETEKCDDWKVDKVRNCPDHCPVGTKHIDIYDQTPADIGHRIANCLADMSIEAFYDNDNSEARAETSCNMVFYVRLFKSRYVQDGVLVELQRSRGCCLKFHRVAHCVLEAAQGKMWKHEMRCQYHMPISPQMREKRERKSSTTKLVRKETVEMSLDTTLSLLKKDIQDASMLAMESLKLYTDTNCTEVDDALIVARKVLYKADSCNCTDDSEIHDAIVSLIKYWRLSSEDLTDKAEYTIEKNHYSIMHHHALCVLGNSMSVLSRAGELVIALENDKWFEDEILTLLMRDIENTKVKTHNSYQATRILNLLVDASKALKEKALDLGVVKLINTVHPNCRHALLASEIHVMRVALDMA